jgi:sec-independent protein translocase protein TatB
MVREADLHEVRASINEVRNFDVRGEIERTVDADGSIRATFASNPLEPTPSRPRVNSVEEIAVSEPAAAEIAPPVRSCAAAQAPAFVPPNLVPSHSEAAGQPEPPAFIPPDVVLQRRSR